MAQTLAKNGLRTVRVEVGWGDINSGDETKLNNSDTLGRTLAACRRWGLRPLILLNPHQSAPTPLEIFDRTVVIQAAPKGVTQFVLASTEGPVLGCSATDHWDAEVLITAIRGQTVPLSGPLPMALSPTT